MINTNLIILLRMLYSRDSWHINLFPLRMNRNEMRGFLKGLLDRIQVAYT